MAMYEVQLLADGAAVARMEMTDDEHAFLKRLAKLLNDPRQDEHAPTMEISKVR